MRTLKSPEALEGKFVRLRLARETDAEFMLALRNDPKKAKCFCSTVSNDIEKQKAFIRKCLGSSNEYLFIIERKDGTPIGMTSIYNIEGDTYTGGRWAMENSALFEETLEAPLLGDGWAFNILGLKQKKCDVLKSNKKVLRWHQITGHETIGEDEKEIFFILKSEKFNSEKRNFLSWIRGE